MNTWVKLWTPLRRSLSSHDSAEINSLAERLGIPLIDYERAGDGLLISSGCGIMLAVMDSVPTLRFCVDIDDAGCGDRFADFIQWIRYWKTVPLFCVGWFSLTSPEPLKRIVDNVRGEVLAYTPGVDLGAIHVETLDQLISHAR